MERWWCTISLGGPVEGSSLGSVGLLITEQAFAAAPCWKASRSLSGDGLRRIYLHVLGFGSNRTLQLLLLIDDVLLLIIIIKYYV